MIRPSDKAAKVCRVLIVEDHTMLSQLFAEVVNSLPGFVVVGRSFGEADALRLCEQHNPDVLILDLVLADASGLSLMRKIRAKGPLPKVLVCSGNLTPEIVREALEIGAVGLVDKTARLEEFRSAVFAVAEGRTYFGSEVATMLKGLVIEQPAPDLPRPRPLTRREQTVLSYVVQGLTSREIAKALGVSFYTVANHRSRLLRKFGLHRATQLPLYATRRNLLPRSAAVPPKE
ncbi:MAG: response regulator transcription factor [Opitutae bacterium]|nr:response regulator transcription factor [Opitutae bacterium]